MKSSRASTGSLPAAAATLRAELGSQLAMLKKFDNEALLARRYERLMSYGL